MEFRTLRRNGVDEAVAWVEVTKAVTEEDGEKGTKNEHSGRRVPICGYPARRLLEIRGEGPIARTKTGRRLGISGFRRQWWNMWRPARDVRYSRSEALRHRQSGPLVFSTDAGEEREVTRVRPNTMRHAHITLMDEAGISGRTNDRYHGHRPRDTQGAHYISRYDMQLLKAAQSVAALYDEAAEIALAMVLEWDVRISL